ncbi:aspartate aminotransferase family protein [Stakelama tenebrarum]|uniref:Acetylornithine aminotransferase n=1 Tax=Stakelama tenebrarum TaxID=2711215 RepID=A0A6G6Y5I3_9SPHN|nr:aspartate aminotransferase family protein [Sphingosinithalassobacter tenebrarum]QIG80159.1 aspartate aminotransferase family protein [Sphingosinithalassobacter tenebrarum]
MTDALLNVYNRAPITVERGEGVWLYDRDGTAWLDCVSGIATNALGHAHPKLVAALTEQAEKLWHVSNIFRVPGQEALAGRLTDGCFADVAFFGNSGSEAVECALKMARRYHWSKGDEKRIDVIGFAGSFHGRTYAAINAAGNPGYVEGFGPRLPGYVQLTVDDGDAIAEAIARPTTAAVIIEPVQGEGGARALSGEWLKRVRDLCTANGVLLIYDEVQSGMGRTGRLFAHQWFEGVEPDIMAVAKALGGGFPIGACLATSEAASGMKFGVHGSTFGGNPLAMAVGLAAFEEIARTTTLAHARSVSEDFYTRLSNLSARHPDVIADVRGKGLLIGLKLKVNNREFMGVARDQRLLVAGGGDNCVRLLPPLIISHDEVEEAVNRLDAACASARAQLELAA